MKTKNTLLVLFLSAMVMGLSAQDFSAERVIKFIDDNAGKKVGNGVCGDLVVRAYKIPYYTWDEKKVKNPEPGDQIVFNRAEWRDGSGKIHYADNHTGVVYKINENGILVFAHQNSNAKTLKDSKVVFGTINTKDELFYSGIAYYHPKYKLIKKPK